jgi:hypothetical protein
VVPFLSHSNARDHFVTELEKLGLPAGKGAKIDRGLIDVVARHTTDMRLMINIGNEFVVYAERLLWIPEEKVTPGLSPDLLFALVVYKNFHLADFEALPHRGSALDKLDKARRDLVNAAITSLQQERASLVSGATRRQRQQELATKLGERLTVVAQAAHMTLSSVTTDSASLDVKAINDPSFWQAIARANKIDMQLAPKISYARSSGLDRTNIASMFPEITTDKEWLDIPSQDDGKRVAEIDAEISALRGIDFKALLDDDKNRLNGKTFSQLAENTLPSKLALDLVRRGYIDRFYAEYATVFYGEFLGVDVAKFFRNSVWPNEMDTQFKFATPGAVENILTQAPADFLSTRSALNIDIVDHLMTIDTSSSSDLIDFLVRPNNKNGHQFLSTYLNTPGSNCENLVSRLAGKPWSGLFNFIASEGTIERDETNVSLLNAALQSAPSFETFELDADARALIARLHTEIPAFCKPQRGVHVKNLFAFLTAALPSIPNIRALSPELRKLVIEAKLYTLDASNLRAAAALPDEMPITADSLKDKTVVWDYCTENIENYLSLVESDEHTMASCASPEVLSQVVNAQHEKWSVGQISAFLEASAKSAALPDITVVEQTAWTTVVDRLCTLPSFTNLKAYATEIGVDEKLAALFTIDGETPVVDIIDMEHATEAQLVPLIALLLNSHAVLRPRQRVLLAKQLLDVAGDLDLDLNVINASPDELLAELLREGMISDAGEVFAHFSNAGWPSIGPALRVSTRAATFITPALVRGHAAEVVQGKGFPDRTRRALLERLVEFAATEDLSFLIEAASAARTMRVWLPTDAILLIAPAVRNHEDVVWQLKEQAGSISAPTVMQILGRMSGDFVGFAGAARQKFEVEDTPSLGTVLDGLKSAGEIVPQPGRQPRGRWKLRIA